MPFRPAEVQVYKRIKGTMQVQLVEENPYWRCVYAQGYDKDQKRHLPAPAICCQNGEWYGDGGAHIAYEDVPKQVWEQARRLPEDRRARYGIVLPEERAAEADDDSLKESVDGLTDERELHEHLPDDREGGGSGELDGGHAHGKRPRGRPRRKPDAVPG